MRTIFSSILIVVLLSAGLGRAGESARDDDLAFRRNLAEGAKLLANGSKESQALALNRFKEARRIHPDSAEAHYWIGLTYSDYQNYADAAAFAEQATVLDGRMAEAWLLWGQSLMYAHQWEKARDKLEQAHRLDPTHPLIVFSRGRCLFHGFDNRTEALELFKETLRLEPPSPPPALAPIFIQARLYIGCCYLGTNMPAAVIAFREVLKRDPKNIEARFRLAVAYRRDGRFEAAEKELLAVLADAPRHADALLQLGHLYLTDLPNREQARTLLDRFLKCCDVDHPWAARVRAYLESQKDAEGVKAKTPVRSPEPKAGSKTPAASAPPAAPVPPPAAGTPKKAAGSK